jgi:hypothetical protein
MAEHMVFRLLCNIMNECLFSLMLVLLAVCGVVASSSRRELIQMMVIGSMDLAAVLSKVNA